VLQRGGNSWWRALWTIAEPHALRLVNDELILIRLSDGVIIARILKPARSVPALQLLLLLLVDVCSFCINMSVKQHLYDDLYVCLPALPKLYIQLTDTSVDSRCLFAVFATLPLSPDLMTLLLKTRCQLTKLKTTTTPPSLSTWTFTTSCIENLLRQRCATATAATSCTARHTEDCALLQPTAATSSIT
jgi:hypothetical protein